MWCLRINGSKTMAIIANENIAHCDMIKQRQKEKWNDIAILQREEKVWRIIITDYSSYSNEMKAMAKRKKAIKANGMWRKLNFVERQLNGNMSQMIILVLQIIVIKAQQRWSFIFLALLALLTQDDTSHDITIFDTMWFAGTNQSETRKNSKRFTMIHMLEIMFNRFMTDFRDYGQMTIEAHENYQTSNEKKHFSIPNTSQEHLILKSHHISQSWQKFEFYGENST